MVPQRRKMAVDGKEDCGAAFFQSRIVDHLLAGGQDEVDFRRVYDVYLRQPLPVAFDDHRETAGGRHAMEIDGARAMAVPGIAIYADTDAIAFHERFGAGQPILPGNGNAVDPNFDLRVTRGLLRGGGEAESPGALELVIGR